MRDQLLVCVARSQTLHFKVAPQLLISRSELSFSSIESTTEVNNIKLKVQSEAGMAWLGNHFFHFYFYFYFLKRKILDEQLLPIQYPFN